MAHKVSRFIFRLNKRSFSSVSNIMTSNNIHQVENHMSQEQPQTAPLEPEIIAKDGTTEIAKLTDIDNKLISIEEQKTKIAIKTEQLRDLEKRYQNLSTLLQFSEETQLEYQQRFIQKGSEFFIKKNQHTQGLQLVHQIDYKSIKQFVEGVKKDEYEFYDKNPYAKEVVILGSANSGKSSIINALNNDCKIAHSAKTSGKTQNLMFYQTENQKGQVGMIVDTPGYGFVVAPIHLKAKWKNMVFKYLGFGVRINLILLCVNGHIGLKTNDIRMLDDLQHFKKPVQVILTKLDKVRNQGDLITIASDTSRQLMKYRDFVNPEIHMTSADYLFGIKELRARIAVAFEENNQVISNSRVPRGQRKF